MSSSSKNFQPSGNERKPQNSVVSTPPRAISPKSLNHIVVPRKQIRLNNESAGHVVSFLVKVVALETVRRISKARFPIVWNTVQALQVLSYPPFKWIQRWTPLGFLIKGIQNLSRPLLILSVTTALIDHSKQCDNERESTGDSQGDSESSSSSLPDNNGVLDEPNEDIVADNWLVQLFRELEKQGIALPERIDEAEVQRFYSAANGDLSILLQSIKKTIRWRETYQLLSVQELERWSHLVFWHGFDLMLRPCLVIRLGFACSKLVPNDRPRFAQAVVSQIEHGVLNLVNEEDPRIAVLMDCEGISPFRFPMQMMRSVTTLVQDNYPNRLGRLVIIRLPPVVRVIAQTFIQVLKPVTRQKLRVEGERYQKALTELLQNVPAFLGGNCNCSQCQKVLGHSGVNIEDSTATTSSKVLPRQKEFDRDSLNSSTFVMETEYPVGVSNCENVVRSVVIGLLMFWIVIAFLAGMNDPDSLSSLPS